MFSGQEKSRRNSFQSSSTSIPSSSSENRNELSFESTQPKTEALTAADLHHVFSHEHGMVLTGVLFLIAASDKSRLLLAEWLVYTSKPS